MLPGQTSHQGRTANRWEKVLDVVVTEPGNITQNVTVTDNSGGRQFIPRQSRRRRCGTIGEDANAAEGDRYRDRFAGLRAERFEVSVQQ